LYSRVTPNLFQKGEQLRRLFFQSRLIERKGLEKSLMELPMIAMTRRPAASTPAITIMSDMPRGIFFLRNQKSDGLQMMAINRERRKGITIAWADRNRQL
jgi:hypothetical protein